MICDGCANNEVPFIFKHFFLFFKFEALNPDAADDDDVVDDDDDEDFEDGPLISCGELDANEVASEVVGEETDNAQQVGVMLLLLAEDEVAGDGADEELGEEAVEEFKSSAGIHSRPSIMFNSSIGLLG